MVRVGRGIPEKWIRQDAQDSYPYPSYECQQTGEFSKNN